jgi:hypothetical protein
VVSDEERRELRALCREHDQMMVEHMAAERIHYKTVETPPRQASAPAAFDEALLDGIAAFVARWTSEKLAPHDERLTELEETVAELKAKLDAVTELKGKLEAVLTLLGQGGGGEGKVITLPDWRSRNVA